VSLVIPVQGASNENRAVFDEYGCRFEKPAERIPCKGLAGRILDIIDGNVRERKHSVARQIRLTSSANLRTTATDESVKTRMWVSLVV
jgi:hypothetical protein